MERAPLPLHALRLDPDRPSVLLDDALGDGEAEAEAAVRGAVRAGKALEDVVLLLLGDPEPVIGDGEMDAVGGLLDLDLDLASVGRVAKSVGDEIGERLIDAVAI